MTPADISQIRDQLTRVDTTTSHILALVQGVNARHDRTDERITGLETRVTNERREVDMRITNERKEVDAKLAPINWRIAYAAGGIAALVMLKNLIFPAIGG